MRRTRKVLITILIIVLILLLCAGLMLSFLSQMHKAAQLHYSPNSQCIYQFYQEEENTLDAVYLGSSAADRYWVPAIAYEEEGICVYNLGTTCQPFVSIKYLINEALKQQPDMDLIIIEPRNIVRPAELIEDRYFLCFADFVPLSTNKKDMIESYLDYCQTVGADINYDVEDYYFPLLRYDPILQNLDDSSSETPTDDSTEEYIDSEPGIQFYWKKLFSQPLSETLAQMEILRSDKEMTVSKGFRINEFSFKQVSLPPCENNTQSIPLSEVNDALLEDLLEYCRSLDTEVLFVSSPFSFQNEDREKLIRYVMERCERAGFDTLDFNCEPLLSEIGMDYKRDYYDFKHVNYWGAQRYTKFLAEYLASTYNMKDHRGDPQYKSWDDSIEKLNDLIITYRPQ